MTQKRFAKKQRRSKEFRKQILVHGEGYSSGKYTSAQSKIEIDEDENVVTPADVQIQNTDIETEEYCDICGGTERNGRVGILGLDFELSVDQIHWVRCDECKNWFHLLCLGIDLEDIPSPHNDWFCPSCSWQIKLAT